MLSRNRINTLSIIFALFTFLLVQGCASREEKIARTLQEADALISDGKTAEAIKTLQEGTTKFGDSPQFFESLGNAFISSSNRAQAVEALKSSVTLDPSRTRLWVRIGNLERTLGNSAQAAAAYQNYLSAFPSDFLAWKSLTEIHQESGDRAGAIESAIVWNRVRPSAEPARILGLLFLEGGNLPQARSWFSQSAAYESGEAARDALAILIELEIGLQQFLPAETWVKRYEENFPNAGNDARVMKAKDVLRRWREAQREIAEVADRIEAQEKALEEKRLVAIENERLAREERERKRREQAAQAQPPEESTAEADDTLTAESDLLDPNTHTKAPTPLTDHDASSPIQNLSRESQPPSPSSYIATAESAIASGDLNAAIDAYWNALGENPNDVASWRALASLYISQQNYFDAEACILEARRIDPQSIEAQALYLSIISNTKKPAEVFAKASAIRSQFPQSPVILFNFAKAIQAANAAPNQVTQAYQAFLDIASPSTPGYQEAQSFLNSGN